jgi:hypothetical protein
VHPLHIRGCIQKIPDWTPGARTVNGIALCHYVQLYHDFVSQSSKFFRHNPLKGTGTSNTKDKHIFRYRLSPETFGYTLVLHHVTGAIGRNRQKPISCVSRHLGTT